MFSYQVDDTLALALPRPAIDAAPLYALIDSDRATLSRFLPWAASTLAVADEEAALRLFMTHFGQGESLNLVLMQAGVPAGMISFNQFAGNASADIGYWLGQPFRGQGLMHRAVAALCTLGFTEYRLNKVIIRAAVENAASNAVAERAGFTLDGTLRQGERLADGYHDENEWSLLKSEWQTRQ